VGSTMLSTFSGVYDAHHLQWGLRCSPPSVGSTMLRTFSGVY